MLSERSSTDALGGASFAAGLRGERRGSSSISSSSLVTVSKNEVGPSCLGSPTTTSCAPRAIAPSASSGRICDASSITTTSKWNSPGGRYCATACGPIMTHGFSAWIARPARLNISLIGMCRPRLLDLVLDEALLRELRDRSVSHAAHAGTAFARWATTCRVSAMNRSSSPANCARRVSCTLPAKRSSSGRSRITASASVRMSR
jgi:hypothetical protein